MSHDDRIRQLTGLFLEDLRAPIEASFRQLLADLVAMAEEDRTTAINQASARASADQEAAVDAARAAAADEREQALEALRATLTREHEAAIEALHAELTARYDTVLATEREELARQHQEALDGLGTELSLRHGAALDALRDELAVEHAAAIRELTGSREDTLETARREASVEREAAVQAAREELRGEHEAVMAALREQLQREHEDAAARLRESWAGEHEAAIGDARAAAEATSAAFAAVEQERDAARASAAELADQLAAARAQHEQLTQLAHAEAEAAAELSAGEVEAHIAERQSELACSERVLAAMRALDEARTLTEILTALADHAGSESIRVAVLVVQGGRLRGWRFAGMGDVQTADVDIPVDQAGVIGRAVELGAAVSTSGAQDLRDEALPPFLAAPPDRVGLALPILVGGRVVAVLYADDAGREAPVVPSNWPEVTEVLARHAGRCLEVQTLSRAVALTHPAAVRPTAPVEGEPGGPSRVLSARQADEAQEEESARRHARLLISEIKLYNEELVERGRREGNLVGLLGSEIERARRLYEEKIPAAVRERVDCFDEEIVRTLAGGDRTLLGQVT